MIDTIIEWVFRFFTFLGFLISCFVLADTKKIKESFSRKARVPEIVKDFEKIFSALKKSLENYNDGNLHIYQKIHEARGLLSSIKEKMPETQKTAIQSFLVFTEKPDQFKDNEDKCWDIYTKLSEIIASIQQLEKNSKWD